MRFLQRWIAPLISIIGFEWLLVELFEYLIGPENFLLNDQSPFIKSFILGSVGLILYLTWSLILVSNDLKKIKSQRIKFYDKVSNSEYTDSLGRILKNAYDERRWSEVIKIGHSLSEPLWYTGKFHIRIDIGELVESAASFDKNENIQAETLIDDLGWTNFRMKNEKEAKKNILLGLRIAQRTNNYYLIAKANRHFADISLVNKKFDECKNYLNIAYEAMKKIEIPAKKAEMNGNLEYTNAKYYFHAEKNNDQALNSTNQSLTLYRSINDEDRAVKLFNLRGKIFLSLDKEEDAIIAFQEGLTLASEISNIVNIVSNSASLAERYLNSGRYEFAKNMIDIARQNSKSMDDPILIETLNSLSALIDAKIDPPK